VGGAENLNADLRPISPLCIWVAECINELGYNERSHGVDN